MPKALTWLAYKVAYAALYAGASAGTAAAIGAVFYYATGYFLLNTATASLTKRGKTGETRGMEVSVVDSTADARVIYGEVRTGGINIIPPYVTGSNGEHLHQVLAFAMHEIDSYQEFYFDTDALPTPTAVTGVANDGLITSGKYANAAWVRGYLGTMTQNVDYKLNLAFPSTWPSTSRGRGVAYAAMQYAWGDGKLYKGLPAVTARLRGARVYDPRLDSTNGGSGSHRYATPSTWAWSDNPALCWANYMLAAYGWGLDPAVDINWPSVITAAGICDALVAKSVSGTQKRYTCNGIIVNAPESLLSNARALVDAMFGRMVYADGQWSCYAGAWTAAEFTIDREDWLSIDDIQAVASRDSGRFNQVRCFYVDPSRNWQRVECYPRRNSTYQSADAAELISIEMEQPLCVNEDEAQRKSEFLLRTSRNGVRLVGTLPPRFLKLRTFSIVALNFAELGWTSKTFRVAACTLNEDGSVRVALTEEQESDWTDLAAGEYNTPSTAVIPATNPTTPSAPQGFSVQTGAGTIIAQWQRPAVFPLGTEYVVYVSSVDDCPPASRAEAWRGTDTQAMIQQSQLSALYLWVQAQVGTFGSAYVPNSFGRSVSPEALVSGLPVIRDADFVSSGFLPAWAPGSVDNTRLSYGVPGERGGYARITVDANLQGTFADLTSKYYLFQRSIAPLSVETATLRVEARYRVNSVLSGGSAPDVALAIGMMNLTGSVSVMAVRESLLSGTLGEIRSARTDVTISTSADLVYPWLRVVNAYTTSGQIDLMVLRATML